MGKEKGQNISAFTKKLATFVTFFLKHEKVSGDVR